MKHQLWSCLAVACWASACVKNAPAPAAPAPVLADPNAPPEGLSVGAVSARGGLGQAEIVLALQRSQIELGDCVVAVEPQLLEHPRQVVLTFDVDPSGHARAPDTQATLADVKAVGCLAHVVATVAYPSASPVTQVRVTLLVARQSTPSASAGAAPEPPEPAGPAAPATAAPTTPAPAEPAQPAHPGDGPPVMVELTHPAPPPPPEPRRKGRFSGGRLAVEIVTGAVVGSLASYGTYKGLCKHGASGCVGGILAAVGVNFAVTPLVEYGVGGAMGGRGSLGWTYLGGSVGFSAEGAPPAAQLAVAVILLPITSGFFYELSSNKNSMPPVTVTPVVGPDGTQGAMVSWAGRF